MPISRPENSIPDTWIACSRTATRPWHRTHRSLKSKRSRPSPPLPPECSPCSTQLLPSARMGTPAGRLRLHPTGNRRDARKRCADLMVYEVIVGGIVGDIVAGKVGGKLHRLELEKAAGGWECRLDGQTVHIDAVITRRDVLSLLVDGRAYEIKREQTATDLHMWVGSTRFAVLQPAASNRPPEEPKPWSIWRPASG